MSTRVLYCFSELGRFSWGRTRLHFYRVCFPSCLTTCSCLPVVLTDSQRRSWLIFHQIPQWPSPPQVESPIRRGVAYNDFRALRSGWGVAGYLISFSRNCAEHESELCDRLPCVWKKCHLISERSIISGACNSLPRRIKEGVMLKPEQWLISWGNKVTRTADWSWGAQLFTNMTALINEKLLLCLFSACTVSCKMMHLFRCQIYYLFLFFSVHR